MTHGPAGIDTLVTLHRLDDENAIFVGCDTQTFTRQHPFGEMEFEGRYPAVFVVRSEWEEMGRPTTLMLRLDVLSKIDAPDALPEGFDS